MALIRAVDETDGKLEYICGETLISKRYVLTAAHCLSGLPPEYKVTSIRLGEYDQSKEQDCGADPGTCAPPVQDIPVEELIPHERFNKEKRLEHDVALIRLAKDAAFTSNLNPICLPLRGIPKEKESDRLKDLSQDKLFVAGWGRTISHIVDGSQILQHVQVPLASHASCNSFYKHRLGNQDVGKKRFCAGGEKGKDSCKGDSGGPIMARMTIDHGNIQVQRMFQFGLVALGPAECAAETPSIYTSVSSYLVWILEHLKA